MKHDWKHDASNPAGYLGCTRCKSMMRYGPAYSWGQRVFFIDGIKERSAIDPDTWYWRTGLYDVGYEPHCITVEDIQRRDSDYEHRRQHG